MEDILGEERVLQASEIELQNSCYRIHVMVVLVPSQRILTLVPSKKKQARKIRILEKGIRREGCNSAGEEDLCSTTPIPPTPTGISRGGAPLQTAAGREASDSISGDLGQLSTSQLGLTLAHSPAQVLQVFW